MKTRSKLPIESFGPELMAALMQGSTKEFRFELPYNDAIKFRRRIHQLRSRMREENHPQRFLVERARVQVLWGKEAGFAEDPEMRRLDNGGRAPRDLRAPACVVIKPYDTEFGEALRKAGVNIDTKVSTDLRVPDRPAGEPETDAEDPLAAFDPSRNEDIQ